MSTVKNKSNEQSLVLKLIEQNNKLIEQNNQIIQINNEQNAQINELLQMLYDDEEERKSDKNLDDE